MKTNFLIRVGLVGMTAGLLGACANGGLDLSTSSISQQQVAKADPVCTSLASQINALKADGTIGRLEQASEGKGAKVSVKREALQKQAELNKAYAQFQTRCSTPAAAGQVAAQQPTQAPATKSQ